MAFMEWKPEWSVGVATMDAQHQKLVGLINQLAEAMFAGKGSSVTRTVLDELVAYTKTHFAAEEQLLAKHGYTELATQKAEHAKFTSKIGDFQTQYNQGKLTLNLELMTFMKDWLVFHIQGRDKQYGSFLNEQGAS